MRKVQIFVQENLATTIKVNDNTEVINSINSLRKRFTKKRSEVKITFDRLNDKITKVYFQYTKKPKLGRIFCPSSRRTL